MGLLHLECPSCGGALSLAEGERIVACRYCGRRNLVLVPGAVPRHVIRPVLDEAAAVRTARTHLQNPAITPAARAPRFDSTVLVYVPFYEATAVRLGTVFMREQVKPPAPLGDGEQSSAELDRWLSQPGEVREDTKVVEQDLVRIGAACEVPELGGERIPLAEMRRRGKDVLLQPFDPVALQSRAIVLAPSVPAERFLDQTAGRVRSQNDATQHVETRLKLLYYPLWQVGFTFRGRAYTVAVDGVSGAVLAGSAPKNHALAAGLSAVGMAFASLGVGRWLRWITSGDTAGPALLVLAIGGAVLAGLAWRWLHDGSEVALGD